MLWEVPHHAHRLRLGRSTERPVGWGWGLEEGPQPNPGRSFSIKLLKGRGERGCRDTPHPRLLKDCSTGFLLMDAL